MVFKIRHKCPSYKELGVKKGYVIINEPLTSGKASTNGIKAAVFFLFTASSVCLWITTKPGVFKVL